MTNINRNRQLSCTKIVLRALIKKTWLYLDNDKWLVLPDAFIPRPNGKDDDGLSVSIAQKKTKGGLLKDLEKLAKSPFFKKVFGVASLCTWKVRRIDKRLNIIADPLPDQPYHALITGLHRSQEPKEIEYLSGKLAEISTIVCPE